MTSETDRLRDAVTTIAGHGVEPPMVALVLGSGLRGFVDQLEDAAEFPFDHMQSWPQPKVEGHGASLVIGRRGGVPVACLTGRVHLYEGWTPNEVVRAVRSLRLWGVEVCLLTNAAGGIAPGFTAGDLMVIQDHINLTGRSALVGEHEESLGPRFPDQTQVYDKELRELLLGCDPQLKQGVYASLLGPSYETPAEVAMLAQLGASAVGMSTVLEATALHAMGARVAGVSLISNLAAGIQKTPLSHDEVIAAGRAAASRLTALLENFLKQGHA
ncbi:MAG: purine-nucleoside phosphorylase [Planctomycetota bacterium]